MHIQMLFNVNITGLYEYSHKHTVLICTISQILVSILDTVS